MQKVVIIGAGNVASSLGPALQTIELLQVVQVWSRTEQSARILADKLRCDYTNQLQEVRRDADIYIYALKDSVLADVIARLDFQPTSKGLHLHTAGSIGLDVFGADKPHCGVFYPFQTFSRSRIIPLVGVPIFIEGNNDADTQQIRQLAQMLSGKVYDFSSANRQWLHIAGVFANNFANVMFGMAQDIIRQHTTLPDDVIYPLMQETVDKLQTMTASEAQTGPAKRGDSAVMKRQYDLLTDHRQKDIYRIVSEIITKGER